MANKATNGRARTASLWSLAVTNLTKLTGAVIGLHAGFAVRPDARVIALAAFMVAGGQVGENVAIAVIDRVLGTGGKQ